MAAAFESQVWRGVRRLVTIRHRLCNRLIVRILKVDTLSAFTTFNEQEEL